MVWSATKVINELKSSKLCTDVHLVQCFGEADPYLAHDGQFAALVVSDDTDFMVSPRLCVCNFSGIIMHENSITFETRDLDLVVEELGIGNIGRDHIGEFVSFVGNDYTKSILNQPVSKGHPKTIKDWLLERAQFVENQSNVLPTSSKKTVIDNLVPLFYSEKVLAELRHFISQNLPDLASAMQYTITSLNNPYEIVFQALKDNSVIIDENGGIPNPFVEFPNLPRSFTDFKKGHVEEPIYMEDFSTSIPTVSQVVIPLNAEIFALAMPLPTSNEKISRSAKISYRTGINYDEHTLNLEEILGTSFPFGPVSREKSAEEKISMYLLDPLLRHTNPKIIEKEKEEKKVKLDFPFTDDIECFGTYTLAFTVVLSHIAEPKDPVTFREFLSLSAMISVLSCLKKISDDIVEVFLAGVKPEISPKLFSDVTIATRVMEVARALRCICTLTGILGTDNGPGTVFHGPLFCWFLAFFSSPKFTGNNFS